VPLRVSSRRSGSTWQHTATLEAPLKHGTQHRYLIEVAADPPALPAPQQMTGTFTTWTQTVRVVFEELHVSNDADHGIALDGDDAGEISFLFSAGNALDGFRSSSLPESDWSSGDRRRLPGELSLVIETQDDVLHVGISGYENDGGVSPEGIYRTLREANSYLGLPTPDLKLETRDNFNAARGSFDLSSILGSAGTIPFLLHSEPNGDGLAFDVKGYIEVTRR
jgi:hypothetical protein